MHYKYIMYELNITCAVLQCNSNKLMQVHICSNHEKKQFHCWCVKISQTHVIIIIARKLLFLEVSLNVMIFAPMGLHVSVHKTGII